MADGRSWRRLHLQSSILHLLCVCMAALLSEADLADAIAEVIGAADDLDFDAHEINWQIAPIDFGKADGVFLRGDDRLGLAFFSAVDGVEHFLLGKAVMVREAFS